jgi:hypothetical protein
MLRWAFACFLLAHLCAGQFVDMKTDIWNQQCAAHSFMFVTNVLIATQPTGGVDVLSLTAPASKADLRCFQIVKSGPVVPPALQHLCAAPTKYMMCTSPQLADKDDRNWTCTDITSIYDQDARRSFTIGSHKTPPMWIKFQWYNVQLGDPCYPLYLTTIAVLRVIDEEKSTLATTIAFSIIGGIVLVIVVIFGGYQFRKLRSKFGSKRQALNKPPTVVGFRPNEEAEAAAEQQPAARGVDLYGEHAIVAPGLQRVQLVDEGVVLESKPLFKPWYERESFRQPTAGLFATDQSPAVRHRRGASPEQIDFSPSGGAAGQLGLRGASPMQMPKQPAAAAAAPPEEEMTVVCTDCFRAVQDPQTPQYCTVTGMRHY